MDIKAYGIFIFSRAQNRHQYIWLRPNAVYLSECTGGAKFY